MGTNYGRHEAAGKKNQIMRIGVNLGPVHVSGSTRPGRTSDDGGLGAVVAVVLVVMAGLIWLIAKIAHLLAWVWSQSVGHWLLVGLIAVVLGTVAHAVAWLTGFVIAAVVDSSRRPQVRNTGQAHGRRVYDPETAQ